MRVDRWTKKGTTMRGLRKPPNRIHTAVAAAVLLVGLGVVVQTAMSVAASSQQVGPYTIDGVIPDTGVGAPIPDPSGSTKELGPINSNSTKIGVINRASPPMLGYTNPNGQVDLNTAWLDLSRANVSGVPHDFLYFAWKRDANSGSGFIAYEFMKNAAPTACAYDTATDAQLISGCNPWANRADGDFMVLWDQQGGSKDLLLRTWHGTAPNLTLDAGFTLTPGATSAAQYSADGYSGEAAVDLTAYHLTTGTGCTTLANSVPSTVTGNSDSADYKDTVLTTKELSNCGSIRIHKQDDAGTALGGVRFNLYNDNAPVGGTPPHGAEDTLVSPAKTCTTATTTDSTAGTVAGECSITGVLFGHYWVVEDTATVPANHTAADDQAVNVTNDTPVLLTFVNARQPGSITITKRDDSVPPVPLGGVTFTIYVDTGTIGVSRGSDDTVVAGSCTTATATTTGPPPTTLGQCTVTGIQLGNYWVVEGTPPSGYSGAADQAVSLTTGGQNVPVTFTDPRTHRVIVLVCHEGSNTLDGSTVRLGSATPSSLSSVPTALANKGVTEADLCGLGGASFGGLVHGSVTDTVTIATH